MTERNSEEYLRRKMKWSSVWTQVFLKDAIEKQEFEIVIIDKNSKL